MARCCGSTGTCACKLEAGRNIQIEGFGSSQDPYRISSDVYLAVEDSDHFDLGLSGNGTLGSPWVLSLDYQSEGGLAGLPDVSDTPPTTGQVLGWDGSTWKPVAPTTAAAGGVLTDASLSGDGSVGAVLQVREDTTRFLASTAAGLGLSDAGLVRQVRIYPDSTTRSNETIPPIVNSLSTLQNRPGRYDYWDGDSWEPITNGIRTVVGPGEMLQLSGPYTAGTGIIQYVAQVTATTDASGDFDIISSTDLSGYGGVLSVDFSANGGTPALVMPRTDTNRIRGRAYRIDTGAAYAGYSVTGTVTALLY